jgi:membrane-anchored glycerophosphoryl diester phosphodiesterase (GDPDase)
MRFYDKWQENVILFVLIVENIIIFIFIKLEKDIMSVRVVGIFGFMINNSQEILRKELLKCGKIKNV